MTYIAPSFIDLPNGLTDSLGDELNARFNDLKTAIISTHDDAANVWDTFLTGGRIVGTDSAVGKPVAGTGLTLNLQNGTYIITGQVVTVNDDAGYIVISGVPSNKTSGVFGYLSVDTNGNPTVASGDWFDSLQSNNGKPCIGKLTTTSTVDAWDYTNYDTVMSYPALVAYVKQIDANSSSGDGGGSGGVSVSDFNALQAQVTALQASITALQNAQSSGVVSVPSESEILHAEVLRLIAWATEHGVDIVKSVKASVDIPGLTGNAEPLPFGESAPVVFAGGNLTRDPDSRSIHP